jgi:SEC-C motif
MCVGGSDDERSMSRKFVDEQILFVIDVLDRIHSQPMANVGRNEACPCGSGRKYKKCCLGKRSSDTPYTNADRDLSLRKFVKSMPPEELEDQKRLFWGRQLAMRDKHKDDLIAQMADYACLWWLLFDAADHGETLADHLLENEPTLAPGERKFFEAVRRTTMQLYEVIAIEPGKGMTLRDVIHRNEVQVQERSASRTLRAWDLIAARVVPKGASGQPELDGGLFPMRDEQRQWLIEQLKQMEVEFDDASRKSLLPMFFFDAWIAPPSLKVLNTDGDTVVVTKVYFDVVDQEKLADALDNALELECGDEASTWSWTEKRKQRDELVWLGSLQIVKGRLEVHTNSRERGERAKTMIEKLAGESAKYRVTEYQDMAHALASVRDKPRESRRLPPELVEPARDVVRQYLQQHYERWVDEPIPMLDGETPRHAATKPELRGRVAKLIEGLEEMYEKAREEGSAAYDPSWMWKELGLEDLAQERSRHIR